MQTFTRERYLHLAESRTPPCVSVYLPTQRVRPGNGEDPLHFKNLLKEVERQLHQRLEKRPAEALLERARELGDRDVWVHPKDGLAVFVSPTLTERYKLPITPPAAAVVSDTFYTRPLLPLLQADAVYFILAVSQGRVAVFEGAYDALDEVRVPNLPANLTAALGEQVTERQLQFHSPRGREGNAMFHGQGSAKDEEDTDIVRFFRAVDAPASEFLNHTHTPVILCALAEHQTIYRRVSKIQNLLPLGIERDPQNEPVRTLVEEARAVMAARREANLRRKLEAFGVAVGPGYGTTDLPRISQAALQGAVLDLLVEEGKRVPGRVDQTTGAILSVNEHPSHTTPDILDDLSEMVFRQNGQVWSVPYERMPSTTGAAAILRF